MKFNTYIKNILESIEEPLQRLDVIFEDAAPRLATFVATHNVSNHDIALAFRKLNVKNIEDFNKSKEISKHIKHLSNTTVSRNGKILCCWPEFYNYFENNVKINNITIDNLFVDFDMEISKDIQKQLHPLSQENGMQTFEKHKQQIQDFRLHQKPSGMLNYHPSGQGVTEYLVDNAKSLNALIHNIYIHCKSDSNAAIMIKLLNDSGYSTSRYKSNIGKETGFII